MTEKDNSTVAAKWIEAREQIARWLRPGEGTVAVGRSVKVRKPKQGELSDLDRDEVAIRAEERWLSEQKATPVIYAARALHEWRKKEERRRLAREADPQALARATVGGQETDDEPEGVRRYSRDEETELRAAVRADCLARFQERFGFEWREEWEKRVIAPDDKWRGLDSAIKVREQLRTAMRHAVDYVNAHRTTGKVAPLGLDWWVPEHIEPLLGHYFMGEDSQENPFYQEAIDRFVDSWDNKNFMGLPSGRLLNVEEFTWIWLLGGGWLKNWPPKEWPADGYTLDGKSGVIYQQRDTMRKAFKRHEERFKEDSPEGPVTVGRWRGAARGPAESK